MSTNQPETRNITDDEFQAMFLQATQDAGAANDFFGIFAYVHELLKGNYSHALNQGTAILMKCRSIDERAYQQIHKGTPFYWLGTAAFLVNAHETAVFFYDAAVSEDIRAGAHPIYHPTPSLRFIQIEGEQPEQAARPLVQAMQARVEEIIIDYNNRPGRPGGIADINLDEIRKSFLSLAVSPGYEKWRTLATALISFCLEWDYRNTLIDLRTSPGTVEPFFLHLFKGCVLFESLLKGNPKQPLPPNISTLGQALKFLHNYLNIPATVSIGNADFGTILKDLSHADNSIQTAIEVTGRIRNTVGHNLGWQVQLDKLQYHRLFRMITSSCLHVIAQLYR